MKKLINLSILSTLLATAAFASPQLSTTCEDLQTAEGAIVSLHYYGGEKSEERKFCYFLSRAVSSQEGKTIGLDGVTMGSIEFCAEAKSADLGLLVTEMADAIKAVPNCFSQMGE